MSDANKTADGQPDFRVLTQGTKIDGGWTKTDDISSKEYVSLSLAAPEFAPKNLYANLGKAAGQDDEHLYSMIWNLVD